MDDFDDFDDWSETEEWDDSDTWDDADDEADWQDWDDASEPGDGDDDGGGWLAASPAHNAEAEAHAVSALEFGVGVAVAGWLLDAHAERIAEAVRSAAAIRAAPSVPRRAWPNLTGEAFDPAAAPLGPGDTLERSRLLRTLAGTDDLVVEAVPIEAQRPTFTVLRSPLIDTLPVWVLFDEGDGGFSSSRLLPVFADQGPPGRAYCYVDTPEAAVRVVEWGLDRHGLTMEQFRWKPE